LRVNNNEIWKFEMISIFEFKFEFDYLYVDIFTYLIKVESAAGLEGLGEELAVDAVLVSSTSIIVHTDDHHHHYQCHYRYDMWYLAGKGLTMTMATTSTAIATTITTMATIREKVDRWWRPPPITITDRRTPNSRFVCGGGKQKP